MAGAGLVQVPTVLYADPRTTQTRAQAGDDGELGQRVHAGRAGIRGHILAVSAQAAWGADDALADPGRHGRDDGDIRDPTLPVHDRTVFHRAGRGVGGFFMEQTPAIVVMQVVLSLRTGGLERVVIDLVKNASEEFRTIVCCLEAPGNWATEVPNVVSLRKRPGVDWTLFGKLKRL